MSVVMIGGSVPRIHPITDATRELLNDLAGEVCLYQQYLEVVGESKRWNCKAILEALDIENWSKTPVVVMTGDHKITVTAGRDGNASIVKVEAL